MAIGKLFCSYVQILRFAAGAGNSIEEWLYNIIVDRRSCPIVDRRSGVERKVSLLYLLKIDFVKGPKEERRACHLHILKKTSMVEGLTPIKQKKDVKPLLFTVIKG